MKVAITKPRTRCAGVVYDVGDTVECNEAQGAKLIAQGRATLDGTRTQPDPDPVGRDDASRPDDDSD